MSYVGSDVHQKRSSICILDRDGKQVKRLEVNGSWGRVVEAVPQVPGPFSATRAQKAEGLISIRGSS